MKITLAISIVYLMLVSAIVVALYKVRENTLAEMGGAKAQADWNKWRVAASKETGEQNPVQRSAPGAAEPPLLMLMRDHFVAAIFALLAPATALYFFFAWIVIGVVRQSRIQKPLNSPKQPNR